MHIPFIFVRAQHLVVEFTILFNTFETLNAYCTAHSLSKTTTTTTTCLHKSVTMLLHSAKLIYYSGLLSKDIKTKLAPINGQLGDNWCLFSFIFQPPSGTIWPFGPARHKNRTVTIYFIFWGGLF